MKKIDFHIHTVATAVDAYFDFDIAKLSEYTEVMELDGVAITNHNMFDLTQFRTISNTLSIAVFPGIEINLGKGHALLISDNSDLEDFAEKCSKVSELVKVASDSIDVAKLREIYGDLSKYLIIPHYDKDPSLDEKSIEQLGDDFIVGEVASAKKFIYAVKNEGLPTPILSSDGRAKSDWNFKARQTFIDTTDLNIRSIKLCLSDKNKVSLSMAEGHELIQVTPDGVAISSGLTVVLGGRSSGKSHTLDEIADFNENVKYIKQFDLIETDPQKAAEKFNNGVGRKQQEDGDKFLKEFRNVIDEVKNISLKADDKKLDEYVSSLLKSASEAERLDLYSKTAIFSEVLFQVPNSDKLEKLIEAVRTLLSPGIYEDIVSESISQQQLAELLVNLVVKFRSETLDQKKRQWANEVVESTKHSLNSLSAYTQVKDVDLLEIARNMRKITKFNEIAKELQKPRTIAEKTVRRFTINESCVPIKRSQDLKDISGRKISFMDSFSKYDNPYEFLISLSEIDELESTAYYKFFTKVEYKILNEYGVAVSGGERAEFRLISEIDGASRFDMLLIDEPESSFDNLFLCTDVNQVIKEIAKTTPVVVVTHNNTVGASIKPDYLVYTERNIVSGIPEYRVYLGRASDHELVSIDGKRISNADVTLKYLEAGKDTYNERGKMYAMLENK